jgi:hypothetical protein
MRREWDSSGLNFYWRKVKLASKFPGNKFKIESKKVQLSLIY